MERDEILSHSQASDRVSGVGEQLTQTSELQQYTTALRARGFRLKDLASRRRPRSAGLRYRLQVVGRGLASDPELSAVVRAGNPLPLRPLARRFQISPHTIRKWENFLVAIALAYMHDVPSIQRYLNDLLDTPPSSYHSPSPS